MQIYGVIEVFSINECVFNSDPFQILLEIGQFYSNKSTFLLYAQINHSTRLYV